MISRFDVQVGRPNMGQYATGPVTECDMLRRNTSGVLPVMLTNNAGMSKNREWHDHCITQEYVVECPKRRECMELQFVHRNMNHE